jgi:hypothetical protein
MEKLNFSAGFLPRMRLKNTCKVNPDPILAVAATVAVANLKERLTAPLRTILRKNGWICEKHIETFFYNEER